MTIENTKAIFDPRSSIKCVFDCPLYGVVKILAIISNLNCNALLDIAFIVFPFRGITFNCETVCLWAN